MATVGHCLYCFEVLAASLERRTALDLAQVELLWNQYLSAEDVTSTGSDEALPGVPVDRDHDGGSRGEAAKTRLTVDENTSPGLRTVNRRNVASPSTDSSSSTPSLMSTASSATTNDSSASTQSSTSIAPHESPVNGSEKGLQSKQEDCPMFITWNTVSKTGNKSLRGCIGTFDAQELEYGLKTYALTSAFEDTRFPPIAFRELQSLDCGVTLLTDFETVSDPMNWEIGKHGLRIAFVHHSKRYGATYLPDVAREQGWTKVETIVSLMRKAGWGGRRQEWDKVDDLQVVRYQGRKEAIPHSVWKAWKDWTLLQDAKPKTKKLERLNKILSS